MKWVGLGGVGHQPEVMSHGNFGVRTTRGGKEVDDALFTRVLGLVGLRVALVVGPRGRKGDRPAERWGPRC